MGCNNQQYDADHFGRLIFTTIRQNVGLKGLIRLRAHLHAQYSHLYSTNTCF